MRRFLFAALLLALGGCGAIGGSGDGGEGVAAVKPSRVTPEELRAAVDDSKLVRFYEGRAWAPAWNAQSAAALVAAIGEAPRHGLAPAIFLADAQRLEAPVAREAALSAAALGYAEALARGRVDPARLHEGYAIARPDPDLAAGLNRALEAGDLAGWLGGLAPRDEEYRLLSEAYLAASRESAAARPAAIPAGPPIRPGGADERLPAIAAALRAQGYAVPEPAGGAPDQAASRRHDEAMVAAVRRLQEDHGLEPDGVIDAEILAALGGGAFDRARTLAVNLERRRWLPREAPATRIDVNTAAATLAYWHDGRVADVRRVVTGQPGNETPQLASPLFRLAANPTWTVPDSIAEEEILPKGPGYLARNRMTIEDGQIVQESGPENSLGLVKFDMRNDQSIYLHDTPAKALFAQAERHRSHGCVRVQDALGFARMIADQQGRLDEWERALATGEETFVNLPTEIVVRLLYHTAFLDGGRIRFRDDVYGWDDEVAEALGLPARPRRTRPSHLSDVGP